jgi:hypothetical protein|tara:strand:- start:382 stop:681 length:300 start_codon:yes stop_codon:yes gene_type:complete
MNLLTFVLAAYGLTQIIVFGRIFNKFRPAHHFFHCSMCVGWWVGLFLWAINQHTELFTFDYSITSAVLLACISSGVSYILNMVFGDEGINFKNRGDNNV